MKSYNNIDMKGRLYNYALQMVTTDKGEAISGEITLEVNADGVTVTVRYFAYPTFNSGKKNNTYDILDAIMNGNYKTVTDDGDAADWLALTGSVDSSYFISKQSTDGELARAQKLRGAFINQNKEKAYSNKWKLDLLITKITEVEADPEKKLDRYLKVAGFYVDDYNKRVMEVAFQVRSEKAIDYISGLEASVDAPYFVATWGQLQTVTRSIVRQNAFGEDETDEYKNTQWVVTGMNPEAYEFGDENAMTADQYSELRAGLAAHMEEQKNKDSEDKPDLAF